MKRSLVFLALVAVLSCSTALAETKFPVKPIQLVVPYQPGGGSDVTGRIFCDAMKEYLPEAMIVSNISGANGMNGMSASSQAKPDGYTILWEHPANLLGVPVVTKAKFRWTDFDVLCAPALADTAILVKADGPYKTFDDLAKDIKARPEQVKWALGINGASHFNYLAVRSQVGDDFNARLVPIGGDKPKIVAILSGSADVATVGYASAVPYIESGDIRVIALMNRERSPYAPEVPTLREQGIDAVYDYMYTALVPKGTPEDVQKILRDAFKKASDDPKLKEALKAQSVTPIFLDKDEATARWAAEAKSLEANLKKNNMVK